MKTRDIWKRVLCFSLPRIPFLILAFLAVILVLFLTALLTILFPRFEALIGTVGILGAILAYTFINRYGFVLYRAGQVAMITRALTVGTLPAHVFAEGKRAVNRRFENVTFGQLFIGTVQTVVMRTIKRRTREEVVKARGHTLMADVRSTAVLYFCKLIPYVGICTVSYQFARQDVPMLQGVCDGIECFFRGMWAMLRRIFVVILLQGLFFLLAAQVFLAVYVTLLKLFPGLVNLLSFLLEYYYDSTADPTVAVASVLTLVSLSALRLFVHPMCAIFILRQYLSVVNEHPSEGKVFGILPARLRERIDARVYPPKSKLKGKSKPKSKKQK